ncbi:MAG: hypothetical protein WD097_01570 [Balneolales bacterium]
MTTKACTVLLFTLLIIQPAIAQSGGESDNNDDQQAYRVVTIDGTTSIGYLVREDDNMIILDVEGLGEITIRRENIRTMTELDESEFVDGRYWFANPQATRYLFAPNALPLGKKKGYYQNTWIFFNNVNYGLSERFSLGVGTVPLFLFGVAGSPVWVIPKLSLPLGTDKLNISAGAMFGGAIGVGFGGVGVLYSNLTYGNRNRNITAGLGFGYVDDGISDRPTVNIAGMYRLSQRYYLISENYFFPSGNDDYSALGAFGVRYAPESFAVDFALVRPEGVGASFIGIPWLGVSIPFDRN